MFCLCDEVGGDPVRASRGRHDDDFAGPGKKIDRTIPRHQRLRGRDVGVPWSHDLVDARNRSGAVGKRSDRVRAAEAEQSTDAGFERRQHDRRIGTRAHRDDVVDTGRPCSDRGHEKRGRQRIAAAGHVAPHTVERYHALLNGHAGTGCHLPRLRNLPVRDFADVSCRQNDRAADIRRHPGGGPTHLRDGHFHRLLESIQLLCVSKERSIPLAADRTDDSSHPPLDQWIAVSTVCYQGIHLTRRRRFNDSHAFAFEVRSSELTWLQHNLVERVFDDAVRVGAFEPRDEVPHRPFVDDRVQCDPGFIRQRRDSWPLQRGKQREHALEIVPPDVEHDADASLRLDRSSQQHRDVAQLRALPVVRERLTVGDELRIRLEDGLDDAEAIRPQRRAGLGHLDDCVGEQRRLDLGRAP